MTRAIHRRPRLTEPTIIDLQDQRAADLIESEAKP